ncbi:MAG: hypothetical protein ACRDMV_12470 [Streptosporangiales bacterium]
MAKSTELAPLFNADTGTARLELLSGVIRAWDSKAATNQVVVGGRTLRDLDVLVGPGTVEFARGDVVGLLRVGWQLVILGKWFYADQGRIPAGILLPGSVATGNVQDYAVTEPKVHDEAVSTRTIVPQAITTVKIAGQAVTLAQLADGSVDASKIVQASITSGLLADDAVTAAKLADGSVTGSAIAQDSIDSSKVTFTAGDIGGASVTLSGTAPSSPAVNDLWIDSSAGYVVKTWNGTDWVESSATVGDGTITAAKLADGSVSAAKLVAGAVGPDQLATAVTSDITNAQSDASQALSDANNISAAQLTDDAVVARTIAAGAVGAVAIAANTITAGQIAAGAIGADELLANVVTAGKIAAEAVLAEAIKAGAVTAEKLDADAVTAGKIAAGAVIAGTIAVGAVGADQIAAGAIVAGKIAAGVVGAEQLAAGSIVAGKIAAGAITGNKLSLGGGEMGNLVPDGGFENGKPSYGTEIGTWNALYSVGGVDAHTGDYYMALAIDTASTDRRLQISPKVPIGGGRSVTVGYWTYGPYHRDTTQRIGVGVQFLDENDTELHYEVELTFEDVGSDWVHCGYPDYVVPPGTASIVVYLDAYGVLDNNVYFDDVSVVANNNSVLFDSGGERIVTSSRIADGGLAPFVISDPVVGEMQFDAQQLRRVEADGTVKSELVISDGGWTFTGEGDVGSASGGIVTINNNGVLGDPTKFLELDVNEIQTNPYGETLNLNLDSGGSVSFGGYVYGGESTAINNRAQIGGWEAENADGNSAVTFTNAAVQCRPLNQGGFRDLVCTKVNEQSDPAVKADIEPMDTAGALGTVRAVPAYEFKMITDSVDDETRGRGVMSIDLPENMVTPGGQDHPDDPDLVSYGDLIGTLWGAVQELASEKEALEQRLARLEAAGA